MLRVPIIIGRHDRNVGGRQQLDTADQPSDSPEDASGPGYSGGDVRAQEADLDRDSGKTYPYISCYISCKLFTYPCTYPYISLQPLYISLQWYLSVHISCSPG